jgi:hypothetical protein
MRNQKYTNRRPRTSNCQCGETRLNPRMELRTFLEAARARLRPEEVGLPAEGTLDNQRRDLKPARTSSEKSSGCSQAAKWPPLSTRL